jgi:biofilm PGA synthesis protein PgaD
VENASLRPLIIERADLQSPAQRYGYASATLVCWLLWLYLFVPLLALIAWALGAMLVYQTLIQGLKPEGLQEVLATYGSGIAGLLVIYLSWAIVSFLRFRGVGRRRTAPVATIAELAASHRLTEPALRQLQAAQRLVLSADDLYRLFSEGPVDAFRPAVPTEPAEDPPAGPSTRGDVVAA